MIKVIELYYSDTCGACKVLKRDTWIDDFKNKLKAKGIEIKEFQDGEFTNVDITALPTFIFKDINGNMKKVEGAISQEQILKELGGKGDTIKNNVIPKQCGGGLDDYYKMKYLKYKAKYMKAKYMNNN